MKTMQCYHTFIHKDNATGKRTKYILYFIMSITFCTIILRLVYQNVVTTI